MSTILVTFPLNPPNECALLDDNVVYRPRLAGEERSMLGARRRGVQGNGSDYATPGSAPTRPHPRGA